MGYYTDYDFSDNRHDVIEAIHEISGYGSGVDGRIDGVKWYDHHEHLLKISKQFPDDVITISGVGEEEGDIWKTYYKNGKHQHCEAVITFAPYDESKLK